MKKKYFFLMIALLNHYLLILRLLLILFLLLIKVYTSYILCNSGNNSNPTNSYQGTDSLSNTNCDAVTTREHELLKLAPILVSTCCYRECLLNLTALDVMKFRMQFSQLNQTDQRKWLTERLYENSHQGVSCNQPIVKYLVSGREVCKEAWCKVLNISEKRNSQIWQSLCKGQVSFNDCRC